MTNLNADARDFRPYPADEPATPRARRGALALGLGALTMILLMWALWLQATPSAHHCIHLSPEEIVGVAVEHTGTAAYCVFELAEGDGVARVYAQAQPRAVVLGSSAVTAVAGVAMTVWWRRSPR